MVYSIAGISVFCLILFFIAHGLGLSVPVYTPALFAWLAAGLLFHKLKGQQRLQVVIIATLGGGGIVWSMVFGEVTNLSQAIYTNQGLLAMLASVSFLRLITQTGVGEEGVLPTGKRALKQTLLGSHLFSTVINMSTIVIVGDRLKQQAAGLSHTQSIMLSRGFSTAAFWSPFFAAMAITITYTGADLITLVSLGLPLSIIALGITLWDLYHHPEIDEFIGYPLHWEALAVPTMLAIAVFSCHILFPKLPILIIISLFSLSLTILLSWIRLRRHGLKKVQQHILTGLPKMAGELNLFLAAGILSTGIALVFQSSVHTLPSIEFGALQASLLILIMLGLSILGVHPVASVATLGTVLTPIVENTNLLGMCFLIVWSLGICSSPLSALSVTFQSRYGARPSSFLTWNGQYMLKMWLVASLWLGLYEFVSTS